LCARVVLVVAVGRAVRVDVSCGLVTVELVDVWVLTWMGLEEGLVVVRVDVFCDLATVELFDVWFLV